MSELLNYKIKKANQLPNKSGAIFLIHGYGSNSEDLFSFKAYLPKNLTIISLEAPIQIETESFAWYSINYNQNFEKWSNNEEAIKSIKKIYETINFLINKQATISQITKNVYLDIDQNLLTVASRNVKAHLIDLIIKKQVKVDDISSDNAIFSLL